MGLSVSKVSSRASTAVTSGTVSIRKLPENQAETASKHV